MERVTDTQNTIEVYENDIDIYLHEFIEIQGIEDMRKESQSVWNACLMYIQRHVFTDRDNLRLKTNLENTNCIMNSTFNCYDYDLVSNILDYYIYISKLNNKMVSISGFSKLTNIPYSNIVEWGNNYNNTNKLSTKGMDIYKKIMQELEESLVDNLADGKKNPIGSIAMLKHYRNWESPYFNDNSREKRVLDATELPRLDGKSAEMLPVNTLSAPEPPVNPT